MDRESMEEEILAERLRAGAAELGVVLSAGVLGRFLKLGELVRVWNERINLTALRTAKEVIDRHFVDAMAVAAFAQAGSLLDVGCGAGFPGLPVALAREDIRVTMLDASFKKTAFVRAAARELNLDVGVVTGRFEEWRSEERFGRVVSRAMAAPERWVKLGAPTVARGGTLMAMMSTEQAVPAAPEGFEAVPEVRYRLPDGTARILMQYRCFT